MKKLIFSPLFLLRRNSSQWTRASSFLRFRDLTLAHHTRQDFVAETLLDNTRIQETDILAAVGIRTQSQHASSHYPNAFEGTATVIGTTFNRLLREEEIHSHVYRSQPMVSILTHMYPVYTRSGYPYKVNFNDILPSISHFSQWFICLGLPTKIVYAFTLCPIRYIQCVKVVLRNLIIRMICSEIPRLVTV